MLMGRRFVRQHQYRRLARTREFDGRMLSLFDRERDRIDGLIAKAPNGGAFATAREDK